MRGRVVVLLVIAAAAMLGWWFLQDGPKPSASPDTSDTNEPGPPTPSATNEADTEDEAPTPKLQGTPDAAAPSRVEEAPAIAPEDRITLRGRVVDARRRPAVGVEVTVQEPGRVARRTATDAEGRFTLDAHRPPPTRWGRASVVARRGEDEVAVVEPGLGAESHSPIDVGVLVLEKGTSVSVVVTDEAGAPAANADVSLYSWTLQGQTPWAQATTGPDGGVVLPPVPDGSYRAIAWREGSGRAVEIFGLPRTDPGPMTLGLSAPRTVQVEVVDGQTGEPVEGVRLEPWERLRGNGWMGTSPYLPLLAPAPTDADGHTEISPLAEEDAAYVIVHAPGRPAPHPRRMSRNLHPKLEPEMTELRIELAAPRVIEWPITDEDGPIPEDGTVLAFGPLPGAVQTSLPETAAIVDGKVRGEGIGPGFVHGLATTPDGRIARLFAAQEASEGNPTSFRPGRTVRARVTYPDGEPATGLFVVLRNQGNNVLHPPVPIDAEGNAVVTGLHGRLAEVYVVPDRAFGWGGFALGSVNLRTGDGDVSGVVARERRGIVRVTIDGEPRLPGRYYLHGATIVEEDPEKGEIHVTWRPAQPDMLGRLHFSAAAYLTEEAAAPFGGTGEEPDVSSVTLASGGELVATVALPEDGRLSVTAQRWDPEKKTWVQGAPYGGPTNQMDPYGRQRFRPLASGRYRVISTATGLVSEEVDVEAGGPVVAVSLDASQVGWVRGTVEVPAGYDVTGVKVRMDGLGALPSNPATTTGVGVWKTGGFGIRIPGAIPVTLVPMHPTLQPAEVGGTAEVTEAREDVVLRLVEGTVAELRLDPVPEIPYQRREKPVTVRLYRGVVEGEALKEVQASLTEGLVRFGGFQAGTYTIWIDAPGFAPAVLADRQLTAGSNDLGDVALARGTTVTIRILVPEGQAPPRVGVSARREGGPAYQRFVSSRGEADVKLPGLGAGRFRLRVYGQMGLSGASRGGIDEMIEVDGETPIERTLDLR